MNEFLKLIAEVKASMERARPVYVLGIIDGYDAVHSVEAKPFQVHDDFWPTAGPRRWRYLIATKQLVSILGEHGEPAYTLQPDELDAVRAHLKRKGYELNE